MRFEINVRRACASGSPLRPTAPTARSLSEPGAHKAPSSIAVIGSREAFGPHGGPRGDCSKELVQQAIKGDLGVVDGPPGHVAAEEAARTMRPVLPIEAGRPSYGRPRRGRRSSPPRPPGQGRRCPWPEGLGVDLAAGGLPPPHLWLSKQLSLALGMEPINIGDGTRRADIHSADWIWLWILEKSFWRGSDRHPPTMPQPGTTAGYRRDAVEEIRAQVNDKGVARTAQA